MAFDLRQFGKFLDENPPQSERVGETDKEPLERLENDFQELSNTYKNLSPEDRKEAWLLIRDQIYFYLKFYAGSDADLSDSINVFVACLAAGKYNKAESIIESLESRDRNLYKVLEFGIKRFYELEDKSTRTK